MELSFLVNLAHPFRFLIGLGSSICVAVLVTAVYSYLRNVIEALTEGGVHC